MKEQELILDIQRLHDTLEGVEPVDECTAATVKQLANDLQISIAQAEGKLPHTGFRDQLEQEAIRFSEDHPAVAQAIRQILNTLNNIGI